VSCRIVAPMSALGPPRPDVVRYAGIESRGSQLYGTNKEMKKMNHDIHRNSFW
jgi:hypothetical protein